MVQMIRYGRATHPPLAAHQPGCADQLDGVAEGCFQPDAGQHCVRFFTQLHVLLFTPEGKQYSGRLKPLNCSLK